MRDTSDRDALVQFLVESLDSDPWIPVYRGRTVGPAVSGWRNRLHGYFWPGPEEGYEKSRSRTDSLQCEGSEIARSIDDPKVVDRAGDFATRVFKWGRTPMPKKVGPSAVCVIRSAVALDPLGLNARGVPMNSGWAKVAAFSTAWLDKQDRSLAIIDSRVAHSLVTRTDRFLADRGHSVPPAWLGAVGRVPGRGGTRAKPPRLTCKWPSAYGKWTSVAAMSTLIREIRNELNSRPNADGVPSTTAKVWTVRDVEMVLFMDGY